MPLSPPSSVNSAFRFPGGVGAGEGVIPGAPGAVAGEGVVSGFPGVVAVVGSGVVGSGVVGSGVVGTGVGAGLVGAGASSIISTPSSATVEPSSAGASFVKSMSSTPRNLFTGGFAAHEAPEKMTPPKSAYKREFAAMPTWFRAQTREAAIHR